MEEILGTVEHITYHNPQNGYTVLELMTGDGEITAVGNMQGLDVGENIRAEGEFIVHPSYGDQFKISKYSVVMPSDASGIMRYLASGAIKGVGPALAKRIVDEFGSDTFRVISEEPECLAKIKGISSRMAMEISVALDEKKDVREALAFICDFGISLTNAIKIYDTYGAQVYKVLKENPYKIVEDIQGIGFKTADEIARQNNIAPDSEYRVRCGILYALSLAFGDGHTYLPVDVLVDRTSELLGVEKDSVSDQLADLAFDRKVTIRDEKVYLTYMYKAELICAARLAELNHPMVSTQKSSAEEEKVEKHLTKIARSLGMEMDELQLKAAKEAILNGVFILSGGPGTGKTSTINLILKYFEENAMSVSLAAPTGRAAKRMTESCGVEAKTIHRLLELTGVVEGEKTAAHFERNADNPLEADVIIIDEMSMVDINLFHYLLEAIVPGTRLILVGDVDQLPSVGPGQVLRELISSNCYHTVMLKRIFRQAQESDIVLNAHIINRGEIPKLGTKSKDFFFLERNDINVMYKQMVLFITEKLPPYVDADSFDIQVLTPMRKGPLGCIQLNNILQQYINPPSSDKNERIYGDIVFREGDKVMQIKNNYQTEWEVKGKYGITVDKGVGVFNGDMGRISNIDNNAMTVTVVYDECREVIYSSATLQELELSYAITIHKSQGSEYAAVIMPLLSGPPMLMNRNLLYTGLTRAKKSVVIFGSSDTVKDMIANTSGKRRYSSLKERILEMNEEEIR